LDDLNLRDQERPTPLDFFRLWIPVARRTALDHVRDVGLFSLEPGLLEKTVEQVPRSSDERLPLLILVGPRSFTDDQDVGVGVPGTEDDVGSGLVKKTQGAALVEFMEFV
jgi:hypothetical protein